MSTIKIKNPETGLWEHIGLPVEAKGMQMDLLWTNPDPTAVYSEQTVELDLEQYDTVAIDFPDAGRHCFSVTHGKSVKYNATVSLNYNYLREVTISDTAIAFSNCFSIVTYGGAPNTYGLSGLNLIPLHIYGIRNVSSASSTGYGTIESINHPGCFYRIINGVQEWLNPPMELDVEYKTTERYLGKPVYTKCVSYGVLPISSEKRVSHGVNNIKNAISVFFELKSTSISSSQCVLMGTDRFIDLAFTDESLITTTTIDASIWDDCKATIKYTKTTD